MKLYEIPRELDAIEELLIETGGELTPELEQRFSDCISQGKDKLESAAFVLCRMDDDAEACDAEIKRLRQRKGTLERNRERLADLTLYALKAMGGKLKTALVTMFTRRSADQIHIEAAPGTDLVELHKQFPELVRVKYELNLEQAKAMQKAGAELPACLLVTKTLGTESLGIR